MRVHVLPFALVLALSLASCSAASVKPQHEENSWGDLFHHVKTSVVAAAESAKEFMDDGMLQVVVAP